MKIKCTNCGWEGNEDELMSFDYFSECCPDCQETNYLVEVSTYEEDDYELDVMSHGFHLVEEIKE